MANRLNNLAVRNIPQNQFVVSKGDISNALQFIEHWGGVIECSSLLIAIRQVQTEGTDDEWDKAEQLIREHSALKYYDKYPEVWDTLNGKYLPIIMDYDEHFIIRYTSPEGRSRRDRFEVKSYDAIRSGL